MKLEDIKAGDVVTRLLAESVPMELNVTQVDEKFIYCGEPNVGWKFLRTTGAEVDEDLGWDGVTRTGSRLTHVQRTVENGVLIRLSMGG